MLNLKLNRFFKFNGKKLFIQTLACREARIDLAARED